MKQRGAMRKHGDRLAGAVRKHGHRLAIACVVLVVVGAWLLCLYLLKDEPLDARGTFGDMFGSVNALFAGLGFAGVAWALILQVRAQEEARRAAIREATDEVFREWWSPELSRLRSYFFLEFVPKHLPKARADPECSLKNLTLQFPGDEGRAKELCYWFDRIGWLGACGLIEVDYVLGPMQHVMRRTWLALEPLILRERRQDIAGHLDPVFQFGIEWLYKRSSEPRCHQVKLIASRFNDPPLRDEDELEALRERITIDESAFSSELRPAGEQLNLPMEPSA